MLGRIQPPGLSSTVQHDLCPPYKPWLLQDCFNSQVFFEKYLYFVEKSAVCWHCFPSNFFDWHTSLLTQKTGLFRSNNSPVAYDPQCSCYCPNTAALSHTLPQNHILTGPRPHREVFPLTSSEGSRKTSLTNKHDHSFLCRKSQTTLRNAAGPPDTS